MEWESWSPRGNELTVARLIFHNRSSIVKCVLDHELGTLRDVMSPLRRRIMVCCWLCCCWALEALAIICIFLRMELSLMLIMPITGNLLATRKLDSAGDGSYLFGSTAGRRCSCR